MKDRAERQAPLSACSGEGRANRRRALATLGAAATAAAGGRPVSGEDRRLDTDPRGHKSVLFVFLTGGLAHLDTWDMKPEAPDSIRGEFQPAATRTPGISICEHLPELAKRSELWTLVRCMTTDSSGHEPACHMLLTGRRDLPPAFNPRSAPSPNEWPTIPAVLTYAMPNTGRLPVAAVLPQPSINEVGKVRPGQYAGRLGKDFEPWHIDIAAPCALGNGACPNCFRFDGDPYEHQSPSVFDVPRLVLPAGGSRRFQSRMSVLQSLHRHHSALNLDDGVQSLDRKRQQAVTVLTDQTAAGAFRVEQEDDKVVGRYGRNKFGLSLLMGRRLIEAGVRFVQVNLGKNSSWDTHRRNFVNLKDNLLPPMDRGLGALLDDLRSSGLLETTLVVVAGEFGRTPKINKDAGRDHWGPVATMLCAGGGVDGGRVIGASDRHGAEPDGEAFAPENLSATFYQALGIPRQAVWTDVDGRPHRIYRGAPIPGLV